MSETNNTTRFDVRALPMNMRAKIMVGFDQKYMNGSPCWEWTGATNSRGYGSCASGRKGKTMLAHRRAYEIVVGPIPEGLTIDHLCRNKVCVNTDHMEPVTGPENTRRALALISHCKQGHPFEGDNLRVVQRRTGHLHRVCVTCQRKWGRVSSRKRRAALKEHKTT